MLFIILGILMGEIKIIIVDDHEIFRSGVKFVLNSIKKFKVIGEACNGKEFLLLIEKELPDIVLLDIKMPEMNGIEAADIVLKTHPQLNIIVLSNYGEEEYYSNLIIAGVQGFVFKNADINELEGAIISVYEGKNYFSQKLLQKLISKKINAIKNSQELKIKLTNREKEILGLIGNGLSNQEIGKKLFLSPLTINNYRSHLLIKTGAKNSANLMIIAVKLGYISIQ